MEDDIEDENLINNNMLPIDNIVDVIKAQLKLKSIIPINQVQDVFLNLKEMVKYFIVL